ncbi:unnamed protein product [Prorocentrum cordatum]|uniref:Heterokaryon incompatibility domain-containing protein n=1 Tax=Prorocentrum cordatum TaxID=2364126 RepID=A0ABN9YAE1_9DINO|nr:unnamed protein product [Polarella glacialis]
MSREEFLALPEDRPMPRHQTLRDQGKLVRIFMTEADVLSGAARTKAAVSHRWVRHWHIDPDCTKLKKLNTILRESPDITHVWIDWACIPQKWKDDATEGRKTFVEQEEFNRTLANVLPYPRARRRARLAVLGGLCSSDRSSAAPRWCP